MNLDDWHSLQRLLGCISVILLIVCFVSVKDRIRESQFNKKIAMPAPLMSGQNEKVRYKTFEMSNRQLRWAFQKNYQSTEKPVKGNGVIYYYYVMKRVR
jgi:Na+/melibiose symporter-like transporter